MDLQISRYCLILLIKDMEMVGMPMLKVKVAFAEELNFNNIDFIGDLEKCIISGDKRKIVDGLEAAANRC